VEWRLILAQHWRHIVRFLSVAVDVIDKLLLYCIVPDLRSGARAGYRACRTAHFLYWKVASESDLGSRV
jgi:hypothetical protein